MEKIYKKKVDDNGVIIKLRKIIKDKGDTVSYIDLSKQDVVDDILKNGTKYYTYNHITEKIGRLIDVVEGKNGQYLRTDGNKIEKDNLGNLPDIKK